MSGNIIAVTFYNKPELLFLYLEQLSKSGILNKYKLRLHTEEGYDKEEDYVISEFKKFNKDIDLKVFVKDKVQCYLVGFNNILTSYTMSIEEDCDYVVIGEEDMLPTVDYLRFNDYCYNKFLKKFNRILGVAHKRRPEAELTGDPEIVIGDYQCTSLSCISKDAISKYIYPVVKDPSFIRDPVSYYFRNYSSSRIRPNDHTHHDGAIERIMEYNNLFVLKPDQSRSMHVGLSGIFCGGNPPRGTFEQRIEKWRYLIEHGNELRSLSNMPSDIVVTDKNGTKWDNLFLDLDRDKAKASSWWYDINNDFQGYINEVGNV